MTTTSTAPIPDIFTCRAGARAAPPDPAHTDHRYPWRLAAVIADFLAAALRPACTRIIVAGSVRRLRADVGDIEIVYISRTAQLPVAGDMFATAPQPMVDRSISVLVDQGVLARRRNANGSEMYGHRNKLMVHIETGIPVDLFATNEDAWHNYLVCRTGPADLNIRIATLAKAKGWKWHPYGSGFSRIINERTPSGATIRTIRHQVTTEADVFTFVDLPHLPPERRHELIP